MQQKRFKKDEQSLDVKVTRTILISKIKDEEERNKIKEFINNSAQVKEFYTIQDSSHLLFAVFYDSRESEKVYKELIKMEKNVIFTVSKYEIPKEGDRCDETKNQGTILLVSRDLNTPFVESEIRELFAEFGDLKAVRDYKPYQKFIEFYDTRGCIASHKKLHEKEHNGGTILIRYIWDMSPQQRWNYIEATDSILKTMDFKNVQPPAPPKIYEKNIFLKALDDFIVENLDNIEEIIQ